MYYRLFQCLEKEIYTQRQSVLGEIEVFRVRESQLRRDMDQQERDLKLRQHYAQSQADDLRKRELLVKQMENDFELKLKAEMTR